MRHEKTGPEVEQGRGRSMGRWNEAYLRPTLYNPRILYIKVALEALDCPTLRGEERSYIIFLPLFIDLRRCGSLDSDRKKLG